MKRGTAFWIGFAIWSAFPGVIEAYFIQTGRKTISDRLGPQAQEHQSAYAVYCIFVGGLVMWLLGKHLPYVKSKINQ